MLTLSEPRIIERGPYSVVGAFGIFSGNDEGPGWQAAERSFFACKHEIPNRTDDCVLGFLYRPHMDDPAIPAETRACFVGVEVADFGHVPAGMAIRVSPAASM